MINVTANGFPMNTKNYINGKNECEMVVVSQGIGLGQILVCTGKEYILKLQ